MATLKYIGLDPATPVCVALPNPDGGITPPAFHQAEGTSYHWANMTILGEFDDKGLHRKVADGWVFVEPFNGLPAMILAEAVERQAFCLMQKSTALVKEQRAQERATHMDLDNRVISILKRYTGEAQLVRIDGADMLIDVTRRPENASEAAVRPINTLDDVRAELAKRGFPEADIRLFMQRRFGV